MHHFSPQNKKCTKIGYFSQKIKFSFSSCHGKMVSMGEFALLGLIIIGFLIGGFLKLADLRKELKKLEAQVTFLKADLDRLKFGEDNEEKKVTKTPFIPSLLVPEQPPSPVPPDDIAEEPDKKQLAAQKENNGLFFGQKLTTWIAAFAAILGTFYFVKYSIEHGFLGPLVRLCLCFLFGVSSIVGGRWLRKKTNIANSQYISQAWSGIGISALYFASYSLSQLYDLAPSWVSLILMVCVTVASMGMTLRYKEQAIALLGLVGGLMTPLLLNNDSATTSFTFSLYMLILSMGFLFLSRYLQSTLLTVLLNIGLYFWVFFWVIYHYHACDSVWLLGMLVLVCLATLRLFPSSENIRNRIFSLSSLAGCFLFAFTFLLRSHFGILEWSLLGVLLGGLAFLSLRNIRQYLWMFISVGFFTAILWGLSLGREYEDWIYLVFTGLVILPFYISVWRKTSQELLLKMKYLAMSAPVLYLLYFLKYDIYDEVGYFGLACVFLYAIRLFKMDYNQEVCRKSSGWMYLSAVLLATLSLWKLIDDKYWIMLLSAELMLAAVIYARTRICYTLRCIVGLSILLWILMGAHIFFILGVLLLPWQSSFHFSADTLNGAFYTLTILPPLLAGAFLFYVFKNRTLKAWAMSITGATGLCALFSLYVLCQMKWYAVSETTLAHGDICFITNFILLLFAAYYYTRFKKAGIALLCLGLWRLVVIHVSVAPPFLSDLTVTNLIFAYGVPLALFMWYAAKSQGKLKTFFSLMSAVLSFLLTSLVLTKIMYKSSDVNDLLLTKNGIFAYSALWFILGCIWLFFAFRSKCMVKPAFGLIYLVIFKVFVYDVASLDGMIRVLSLFGLAVGLFGVSHVYTRFFTGKNIPDNQSDGGT